MSKSISLKNALKKAQQTGISVYRYIKEEINYQKADGPKKCDNCQMKRLPSLIGKILTRCELIGVNIHPYAEIKLDHVCKHHSILTPEISEPGEDDLFSQEENTNAIEM